MTPEQIDIFKTSITAAVDKHIADGGKLLQHRFESEGDKCPIACLAPRKSVEYRYTKTLSQTLGFEVSWDEMWQVIDGFDGLYELFPKLELTELAKFGRELQHKYIVYIDSPKKLSSCTSY